MINKDINSLETEIKEASGILVAVAIAIFNKKGQMLLGKRLSGAGLGTWHMPGGHLKSNETLTDCARREIREELGDDFEVDVASDVIAVRENRVAPQFIHHIAVFVRGNHKLGDPKVNEPDKCEKWEWFNLDNLPMPMFSGEGEILKNFRSGKILIVSDW